jgi:hypothetical protein
VSTADTLSQLIISNPNRYPNKSGSSLERHLLEPEQIWAVVGATLAGNAMMQLVGTRINLGSRWSDIGWYPNKSGLSLERHLLEPEQIWVVVGATSAGKTLESPILADTVGVIQQRGRRMIRK